MSNFSVIYDACVLYPAPLRDLLVYLALSDLFRAKWTDKIHEEWIRNVLKNRPDLTLAQLYRTRDLMNENVLDCLVENYEEIIPTLALPDENDRHVLAAAIRSSASVIVTYNIKDFPKKILDAYEIEAQHPDEFIMHLLDLNQSIIFSLIKTHRQSLKNPPLLIENYLENLERQGLARTVNYLRMFSDLI